jgi:hypothetical protein
VNICIGKTCCMPRFFLLMSFIFLYAMAMFFWCMGIWLTKFDLNGSYVPCKYQLQIWKMTKTLC